MNDIFANRQLDALRVLNSLKCLFLSVGFLFCVPKIFGQTQSGGYKIEKLPTSINTPSADEISPVISMDGKTLFFTRAKSEEFNQTIWIDGEDVSVAMKYKDILHNMAKIYSEIAGYTIFDPVHSEFNQDIWYAESIDSIFDHVVHPTQPLNNILPNSICSTTPKPNQYVVINQFSREGGMSRGFSIVTKNEDHSWSEPQPIVIKNFDATADISLTMSIDGNVIIISIPGKDSYGDNDLYICFKEGDNTFSEPKNMGAAINTKYREVTPNLSADGKELYFASNRPGKGGLDLYYVSRIGENWNRWSEVRHFVYPINTSADEAQPYFSPSTGNLYFSSRRDGSSDIYSVNIAPPEPVEILIMGRVINSKSKNIIDRRILYGDADSSNYQNYVETNGGRFFIKVPRGKKIKMLAMRPGYIDHEVGLKFEFNTYYPTQEITLQLDSVTVGSTIALNPIFFEQSKAYIKKESYEELDYLASILKKFPEICVRIEGHTDNQGKAGELQKLSEDRATEVKKFLVRNKINPKRLESIGFGASQPLLDNSTETSRSKNRRVEVKIVRIQYGL